LNSKKFIRKMEKIVANIIVELMHSLCSHLDKFDKKKVQKRCILSFQDATSKYHKNNNFNNLEKKLVE